MSGGSSRHRGQKYQNVTVFRNDKYKPNERLKVCILGCGSRCRKCNSRIFSSLHTHTINCLQKTVKTSYHKVCPACSIRRGVCAKCGSANCTLTSQTKVRWEMELASASSSSAVNGHEGQHFKDANKHGIEGYDEIGDESLNVQIDIV
uniref:Uncharacterized protein n=1 Tax=Eptatretus burgeri TaxID=7764 RepID=A0A8C4QP51_EPTBU